MKTFAFRRTAELLFEFISNQTIHLSVNQIAGDQRSTGVAVRANAKLPEGSLKGQSRGLNEMSVPLAVKRLPSAETLLLSSYSSDFILKSFN